MRMERLLADVEAEQEARRRGEARAELADGVRVERASVSLADRLRGALGTQIAVAAAGETLRGCLLAVGDGWLALGRPPHDRPTTSSDELVRVGVRVVALDAIETVRGLGVRHEAAPTSTVGLTWGSILRAVARSRAVVAWHLRSGECVTGAIGAVGVDHVVAGAQAGESIVLALQALTWFEIEGARRD